AGAGFVRAASFVIPHIVEKSGLVANNVPFTFDTTIFADYVAGQADVGGTNTGATIEVFLYNNNTGAFLVRNGQNACDGSPHVCQFSLGGANNRKASIRIEDLILAVDPGFNATVLAYGILTVGGDSANVAMQGFVTNSHTNAFDVAVFGFAPVPI